MSSQTHVASPELSKTLYKLSGLESDYPATQFANTPQEMLAIELFKQGILQP